MSVIYGNMVGGSASSSGGLSDDEKTLLLNLLKNAVYTGANLSVSLSQLETLLHGGEVITFSVTYNLTDVTIDNTAETAKAGFPYIATLTVAEGEEINTASLSVIMGGEDITESVYSDGVISIPVVSGEIVIIAEAIEEGLIYDLGKETVFDGTAYVDTGVHLFDKSKEFTLAFAFSCSKYVGSVFIESVSNPTNPAGQSIAMLRWGDGRWVFRQWGNGRTYLLSESAVNRKYIITYNGVDKINIYYIDENSIIVNTEITMKSGSYYGLTDTLKLGAHANDASNPGFVGTIHSFKVYEKVFDESEINAFMGV